MLGYFQDVRFSMITLEPPCGRLISLRGPLLIPKLNLINLCQILLMRRCSPEIALAYVMIYGLLQNARTILWVRFSVGLVGFRQRVGSVIGFIQVLGLDAGSSLKG